MPSASRSKVCLRGCGQRFANGMSNEYSSVYPRDLEGIVEESKFRSVMNEINDIMQTYWPCPFCFAFGWGCCLCTAGLSLLCPNMCVSEAERYLHKHLQQVNGRRAFLDAGVEWRASRCACTSAIEVHYPAQEAGSAAKPFSSMAAVAPASNVDNSLPSNAT